MFYDDEPEELPWDYFLTNYERELLTLTLEELVRRNPDKSLNQLNIDLKKISENQAIFEALNKKDDHF